MGKATKRRQRHGRQAQTKGQSTEGRGGMNEDTEDTPLETEIYMILLYNLICESGDRVRGRSVMELEEKRE